MSDAYTITFSGQGDAAEWMRKKYAETLPIGFHEAITKAAADKVRGHLKRRDQTHANQLGGKRSHFYFQAAQSVTGTSTPEGGVVTINKLGLRQRWLGGNIYPVNAKYLAIPARSEAYGVSPKDFPGDLKVVRFRSGTLALVKDDQRHTVDESGSMQIRSAARGDFRSRKRGIGLVEYWLKDHVYQTPDPDVLPGPKEVLDAVTEAASFYIKDNPL